MNLGQLLASLAKAGGLVAGGLGAAHGNWQQMTIGAALTAIVHWIDSHENSPKGASPTT